MSRPQMYYEGMPEKEQADLGYWERNMMALFFAVSGNDSYLAFNDYLKAVGSSSYNPNPKLPHGWYRHEGEGFEGWSRVISLADGKITFHIPDSFDIGNRLPEIKPNWNGHTSDEKWDRVSKFLGIGTQDPS